MSNTILDPVGAALDTATICDGCEGSGEHAARPCSDCPPCSGTGRSLVRTALVPCPVCCEDRWSNDGYWVSRDDCDACAFEGEVRVTWIDGDEEARVLWHRDYDESQAPTVYVGDVEEWLATRRVRRWEVAAGAAYIHEQFERARKIGVDTAELRANRRRWFRAQRGAEVAAEHAARSADSMPAFVGVMEHELPHRDVLLRCTVRICASNEARAKRRKVHRQPPERQGGSVMDWLDDLERKAKAATPFRYMADPWDERDGDFIAAASPDVVLRLIRALRDAQLSLGHFPDGLDAEVRVNRILAGKEPTP